MEIYINIIIFIMGTFFGSFFTLAVYRLPLHKDITHEHSFCPNCNHKLGILDLIPVLSYIFLGGKCRYCKEKIRIRYLLLEVLSGVVFVLLLNSVNIDLYNINNTSLVAFAFSAFFYTALAINAGISKEAEKWQKSVCVYEIIILAVYILYLCIVEVANIYRYGIYLIAFIISLVCFYILGRIKSTNKYFLINIINVVLLIISNYIIFR